jgi:hypothetical protein
MNIFGPKYSTDIDFYYKEKRGRKAGRPALAATAYKK